MNALDTRIGPLGQLYDAPFQADLPVPERFEKVLDFVTGHGFACYGLSTRTHIHPSQLPGFQACAAKAGLQVHLVSHVLHPFDQPTLQHRIHASVHVQARRLEHAALAGVASCTFNPPRTSSCALDELEADVGKIRDLAGAHAGLLRITNGAAAIHHLATVEALVDFCKRLSVAPTIGVGAEFLATGHARDVDGWREVLAAVPNETVFTYANHRVRPGMEPSLSIYNDDAEAAPPVKPLLQAILESGQQATVLVQGDRPEADALGVMRVQAALEGKDMAQLARQSLTHMHRRVATVAASE